MGFLGRGFFCYFCLFSESMNDDVPPFSVSISGLPAAGKTALLRIWRRIVGCSTYEEPVIDNPYLDDLYSNPRRWSFEMDVYMLNVRLEAQNHIADEQHFIQDRCYEEDAVFAATRAKMGFVDQRAQNTYREHLEMLSRVMKECTVVVYLGIHAKECMRRIKKRNRECEQGIPQAYLDKLCAGYEEWVQNVSERVQVLRVEPEQIYVESGFEEEIEHKAAALWELVLAVLADQSPSPPRALTPPGSPSVVPSIPNSITVVGPISAGKTTIVDVWGKKTGYKIHKEPVSENVYLEDYYRDQERWAFETQIYLLNKRLKAQLEVELEDRTIQDRSYLDDEVFEETQVAMGYMDQRSHENYRKYFVNISRKMRRPDVIVFVAISSKESKKRILERNRDCELDIDQGYLDELGRQYETWIERISETIPVFKVDGKKMSVTAESETEKDRKIETRTMRLWDKICELFERERPENGIWEVQI